MDIEEIEFIKFINALLDFALKLLQLITRQLVNKPSFPESKKKGNPKKFKNMKT